MRDSQASKFGSVSESLPILNKFLIKENTAVAGWAMNDPGPYRTTFADLAKSTSAQASFFESLVTFMEANDFNGIDIDWEYPVVEDRGGIPEDFDNYVTFLKNLRNHLNGSGRQYGVSLTLISQSSLWNV
jgi:chitinase